MKVLKWVGGNVPIDVLHELALQCHFDRRHYFSQYFPEPFCIQASLGKGCNFLLRDSSEEGGDSE